jgi:hypothetical protein
MASTTAESMPPESRTTAGFTGQRLVVPQELVQLHLEPHRQPVRHDPVGQRARVELVLARREQHLAAFVQAVLGEHRARPVVVGPVAQHELDLVVRRQQFDVRPQVAIDFAGTRRLEVEHPRHPRVDLADADRSRGFQRHRMAGVAQPPQQPDAALLRQRLATGHADMAHALALYLGEDLVDRPPAATVEGVGGVAVLAAQRAAGQAHEHGRAPRVAGLALQGQEDLGDAQPVGVRGGGRVRDGRILDAGIHRSILPEAAARPRARAPQRRPVSRIARRRSSAVRAASVPG